MANPRFRIQDQPLDIAALISVCLCGTTISRAGYVLGINF